MLIALFSVSAVTARNSKHYRSDYEYNAKTDAFYKFHPESTRQWSCNQICEIEGAKIMQIESHEDVVQTHGTFKKYPDLPNYAWVGLDGATHESTEEKPLIYLSQEVSDTDGQCDVVSRSGEINSYPCYQQLPFFCKVKASDAYYDSKCGVYGKNYVHKPQIGSCYKISESAYSWNEAYAECRAEGAHLLIVNSVAESLVIQELTRRVSVRGSRFPWFYFAGFRAAPPLGNETLVFKTIFNQTLDEAGYNKWSPNEPNNNLGNEFCGTFFKSDGKFNDVNCVHEYGFICESENISQEDKQKDLDQYMRSHLLQRPRIY